MGEGESCRTARSGRCLAGTWACRSMSEHTGPIGGGSGVWVRASRPGRVWVGYGRVRVGYGRVMVRSALGRLGRPESCGARLGRASSEVCQIRVRLKAQVNVSVSGMSKAWLRAGPGLLMRACEIQPSLTAPVAAWGYEWAAGQCDMVVPTRILTAGLRGSDAGLVGPGLGQAGECG